MKSEYQGVIFTNHALARLRERGITQGTAWYTWRRPTRQTRGSSPGSVCFSRQDGNQEIRVIAKKNDQGQWLILSVWAKIKGNNRLPEKRKTPSLVCRLLGRWLGRRQANDSG